MELVYNIKVRQKHNPKMSSLERIEDTSLSITKNFQGVTIDATEPFKGGFHKKTNKLVARYKTKDGIVFGEELKTSNSMIEREYSKISFPVSSVSDFMSKFRDHLAFIDNFKLSETLDLRSRFEVLYFNTVDSKIHRLEPKDFEIDLTNRTIKILKTLNLKLIKFLSINFPINYSYNKESSSTFIDVESLISIDSGFYNLVNKKVLFPYTIEQLKNGIEIATTEVLNLDSDVNITFGSISTNSYFIPPNVSIKASYNPQDYTPLLGKTAFDYSSNLMYIIYELHGETYKPKYKLPKDKDVADLKLLLQSHDEFKRPYVYIANKAKLVIKDVLKNEESLTINNLSFQELYNNF